MNTGATASQGVPLFYPMYGPSYTIRMFLHCVCVGCGSMKLTPATSEVYPDPLSFNPDRFLDFEKNRREGINDIPDAAFGFGRRSDKSCCIHVLWRMLMI